MMAGKLPIKNFGCQATTNKCKYTVNCQLQLTNNNKPAKEEHIMFKQQLPHNQKMKNRYIDHGNNEEQVLQQLLLAWTLVQHCGQYDKKKKKNMIIMQLLVQVAVYDAQGSIATHTINLKMEHNNNNNIMNKHNIIIKNPKL